VLIHSKKYDTVEREFGRSNEVFVRIGFTHRSTAEYTGELIMSDFVTSGDEMSCFNRVTASDRT